MHIDNASNRIALLKPTSRLLSLFIKNNNKLLLRERLLNDVWVDHGLKASNNNLNNYVSGLRKSLAQFGAEEIIVTYPRQGFKFIARNIHEANENKVEIYREEKHRETEIASTPPPGLLPRHPTSITTLNNDCRCLPGAFCHHCAVSKQHAHQRLSPWELPKLPGVQHDFRWRQPGEHQAGDTTGGLQLPYAGRRLLLR